MTRIWIAVVACSVLCSTSCDDGGVICTDEVVPGLVVTILDAQTGEPRSGIATAVAIDGAYVDTLVPHGGDGFGREFSKSGAYERPGTYDLRVTAPDYLEWSRKAIRLTAERCHVRTAQIEARLILDSSRKRSS